MPRIDPLKLLTCLKVLLASNGGIRSENEVKRLAGLMTKYSKKLVSKCIYIQILKCTNTELLGEFMGAGGWSLTHMWLSDGIHAMNWPLVQEILELLLLCPVDVQRLRSNTAPKLVKGLCQNGGNEGVRILATKLVEQWLKVVKGETMPTLQTNNHVVTQNSAPQITVEAAGPQTSKVAGNTTKNNSTTDKTNAAIMEPPQASNNEHVEEDPLAIPSNKTGEPAIAQGALSPPVAQKASGENALVYQIIVKDGKQVLAKIENSSTGEKSENLVSDENEAKVEENKETKSDEKDADASNKENEKHKNKELEGKETKDKDSLKDKEKSRNSREKEKHRDHKSSSHRSSSSKSSKSSSSSSTSSSSKIKSSHKSSSENKSRDKDSDKDRDSEKEKDKYKSRSSSSSRDKSRDKERSSKDKERKDRDKDKEKEKERDKEKEKIDQAEKDKETLSKVIPPSLDKLGKIPKKPKDESDKTTPTSITIPSKKASISIEIRKDSENRPKTVKTYKSQFRSHGLSEEAPPPPSRKGLKKPSSQPVLGTAIPSSTLNLNLKRSSPPPAAGSSPSSKDTAAPPVEKKLKLDMTGTGIPEKPGAIKLITPKPKPSTLVESDLFMDALSASAYFKKDTKKRKRRPSASKDAAKEGNTTTSPPESPQSASPTNKVTPLKFYQDTLEEKDEERMDTSEDAKDEKDEEKKEDEDDIPLKRVKESIEEKVRQEKEEEVRRRELEDDDEEPVKKPPGPGCGPDGPPGVLMLHRRRGPKKKLTWRPQEELEDIRYFELDETERVNVTKTFTDMKQMERYNEREAFLMARKLNGEDIMSEQTSWMPLILVDEVPPHPEGSQSKEKKIQAERELTTLKALYFNRHMIPDSPAEPDMDMEQYQKTEPAVIPLDDITGNPDAVNDFTSMPWPDSKGSPPQCMPDDYPGPQEVPINNGPFNPFMQFGQPGWAPMGGPPGPAVPPSNMMPPNMMGDPMGGFNNMNPMNTMPPNMNMGPPNMMMGPPGPGPEVMPMNQMNNMNMMQPPFGPGGPNFGGPPNGPNNFGNFGPPPPNMNMNNMSPPMNMNNGPPPPRNNNNRGGNWRSGSGPPNNQGGNWRPQGPGNNRNWTHGNNGRICKQFQRGYCRNGNKCNFLHPPKNF